MKYLKIIFGILMLLLKTRAYTAGTLDTTLTGTDATVYVKNHITFDPTAYVLGFVSFENGFSLSPTATLSFESLDVVNGAINLNNGTLKLTGDLHLGSSSSIVGPGYINLQNGNSINFNSQTLFTGGNVRIIGSGAFGGSGGSIGFVGGALNFTGAGSIRFLNLTIDGITATNFITAPFGSGQFSFFNVVLNLDSNSLTPLTCYYNISITNGGYLNINGPGTRIIFTKTIMFQQSIVLSMGYNTTIQLGGDSTTITTVSGDDSGQIYLDNATLEFAGTNNQIYGLQFFIDGNCTIASTNNNGQLYLGNGLYSDTKFVINPGGKLKVADNTRIQYQCAN